MVAGRICGPWVVRVDGDSQLAAAHANTPSTMTLCRVFIRRRKVAQYRLMPELASDNLPGQPPTDVSATPEPGARRRRNPSGWTARAFSPNRAVVGRGG